jgi:ferredoxin-NADP reductase
MRLLYSACTWDDVIYREELQRLGRRPEVQVRLALTRDVPRDWRGYRRRIDRAMLAETGWPPSAMPHVFVCGPTPFVELAATLVVQLGHDSSRVRMGRFGPTG